MPIEILMPALSPTMTEGTLAKWLKKEGDDVAAGDVIAEIETDKATMEVEAVDEGKIGKIVVGENSDNVPVNKVIALLMEEGETKSDIDSYEIKDELVKKAEVEEKPEEPQATNDATPQNTTHNAQKTLAPQATKAPISSASADIGNPSDKRIKASPIAKRLATEYGINLSAIIGTGPKGRIVKKDVEDAQARGGSTSGIVRRDPNEFITIPNSNMRKTVARRLTESKQQVPHFYLSIECQIDKLLDVRQQMNDIAAEQAEKGEKPTYKVSVNDMIIKACALSMKDIPEANASWYDDAIVQYNNVDISIAVAIEGGLITPIVRNADQKTLVQISNEMKELAARARKGELMPEEYEGGGFSISNLGMFGIKQFSAIVNPPQSCILAVGSAEKRPIFDKDGNIKASTILGVTLSVDHRAVDGAVGATFLNALKKYLEKPALLLL